MATASVSSISNSRPPRRQDELRTVCFEFTRYLIGRRAITPQCTRLSKPELFVHFSVFQSFLPSYVQAAVLIDALNKNKLLVKRSVDVAPNVVEFRKIVFAPSPSVYSGLQPVKLEALQQPRMQVFVKDGRVFHNNAPREVAVNALTCLMCKKTFDDNDGLNEHINSKLHQLRDLYRTDRRKLKVEIPGLAIQTAETRLLETEALDESVVRISNTSGGSFNVLEVLSLVILDEVRVELPTERTITPGKVLEVKIVASFPDYGTYEYPMVFTIRDSAKAVRESLVVVTYRVLKKEVHDLHSDSVYQPEEREKWVVFQDAPIVSGIPLPSLMKVNYKVTLLPYPIPNYGYLVKFLKNGFKPNDTFTDDERAHLAEMKEILYGGVPRTPFRGKDQWTPMNYVKRFQRLLHLEEYQQKVSLLSYNRQDVQLKKGELGRMEVEIPGLSEGRPSILKGDSLFVWPAHKRNKYEGVVHDVRENTASLAFSRQFNYITNEKVGIEFQLNRISFRILHRALDMVTENNLASFGFPKLLKEDTDCTYVVKQFFNKRIEDNASQKLAVNNIVRNTAYPAPYIIYGPPGTGKTSTVVEAIAQLARKEGNAFKICACATSNAAANLLALKLIECVPQTKILRLFSFSYPAREVPKELHKCSNFSGVKDNIFFPSCEEIESKAIVIVTPITAGRLYGVLGKATFDYLFFDEAGQTEEPLALVPITGLLKKDSLGNVLGKLILAGDPKQLGPIIHSALARELGLDVSIIERLMDTTEPYKKKNGAFNANYITQLLYNYRSHPKLLHVPKELFYDSDLESHADPSITQWLCSWERLPVKNVPLIFHGVTGKDDRESNSPSYYNLDEISQVGSYLTDLLGVKMKGREVKQEDVVVLTPYRKQVQKFVQYLKSKKWDKIRVSSIEKFQGQESPVVILSCVRSRKEFLPSDYQFGLGFLRNPKRFNVAITRAKSLMIVVGNPNILQCDPKWRVFLRYCKTEGCYRGVEPDGEVADVDANKTLALDLSALAISEVPHDEKPAFLKDD